MIPTMFHLIGPAVHFRQVFLYWISSIISIINHGYYENDAISINLQLFIYNYQLDANLSTGQIRGREWFIIIIYQIKKIIPVECEEIFVAAKCLLTVTGGI